MQTSATNKHLRAVLVIGALTLVTLPSARAEDTLRISVREYRDKMKAGWIGQIAGVSLGGPTEFKWRDAIIPEEKMPSWKPSLINEAFGQDDLYVEMTFLRTLEQYGLNVSIRQAGIDFANSGYPLWCANNAGRTNLRNGIAPPDSSHPTFNKCPNDIDYQIEADFSGLIAPGIPQNAIDMGGKFGRLMNYGDGMYAGQFIGAMYAAAFFETDPVRIIEVALKSIPAGSQYAEMVRDMLSWFRNNPDDWQKTWKLTQAKYREDPAYQKASNGGIDCKINGAYVLLGLLYGKRDFEQTMIISCRAGQDSDCNPSSSAGVLFTTVGFSKLPDRFSKELDEQKIFSHTAYNFPKLIDACEKIARQVVKKYGGRIEKDKSGEEFFVVPVLDVRPSPLELSWAPGPVANSKFTRSEMAKIKKSNLPDAVVEGVGKWAPGWQVKNCGQEMDPGVKEEFRGRKNVLVTHPLNQTTGCTLTRTVKVPKGKNTALRLAVSHYPDGDYDLIVRANGEELFRSPVGPKTVTDGWLTREIDLSAFAGKKVKLELINQPSGWAWEAGYWGELSIRSQPK